MQSETLEEEERRKQRILKAQEKLTYYIVYFGLWQLQHEVLEIITTKKEKE